MTLPSSMPSRSQIRCASSTCDVPQKILMFGIFPWTSGIDWNQLEPKNFKSHTTTSQQLKPIFSRQPQERVTCFRLTNGAILSKTVRHRWLCRCAWVCKHRGCKTRKFTKCRVHGSEQEPCRLESWGNQCRLKLSSLKFAAFKFRRAVPWCSLLFFTKSAFHC